MSKLTYCADFCDIYNENYIYSKYGFGCKKPYRIYGKTMHGWLEKELIGSPEYVLGSPDYFNNKAMLLIVHRADQEKYLRDQGYLNSFAIGSPFIYIPKPKEKKRIGFLVMAQHGIDKKTLGTFKLCGYVKNIINNGFKATDLTVIIHHNDMKDKNIVNAVKELGVSVVMGARGLDGTLFVRLADLFSKSEGVITNAYGSHIPYAHYFGCKVEFHEPFFEDSWENLSHLPGFGTVYKREVFERDIKFTSLKSLENRFPFLFEKPYKAFPQWAGEQLGESQKKTPQELAKIFGWNLFNDIKYYSRFIPGEFYRRITGAFK